MIPKRTHPAYTIIEMLVAIAIIGIMLGIFIGAYGTTRDYDTLKLETQRMAAALRRIRTQDFNGITSYTTTCSNNTTQPCVDATTCGGGTCTVPAYLYPSYGYGLHLDTNTNVCTNNAQATCHAAFSTECSGTCSVASGQSSSIYFANILDRSNPFSNSKHFSVGKSWYEFMDEFKLSKNFKIVPMTGTATEVDIIFRNGIPAVYEDNSATPVSTATPYVFTIVYTGGSGTPTCSPRTRSLKGQITIDYNAKNIYDNLVAC